MGRSRRKFWLSFLLLIAVVVSAPFLWLPWLGRALVRDDGPGKADAVVVLAGDFHGRRILFAADLVRQGYAPVVVVSGPPLLDLHECDLLIQFAARKGHPAEWFARLPNSALSTREEAVFVLDELQRRGARSFLLVTSDYHTARAGRIYRSAIQRRGGAQEMRVVAAPDRWFRADGWWKSREGLKIAFMEWSKTLAAAVGI